MLYFLVTLMKERRRATLFSNLPPSIQEVAEILVLRKEGASSGEVSSELSQCLS